jgi:hypothetical protein
MYQNNVHTLLSLSQGSNIDSGKLSNTRFQNCDLYESQMPYCSESLSQIQRTLRGISRAVGLLEQGDFSQEEVYQILDILVGQIDRLERLLSKIQNPPIHLLLKWKIQYVSRATSLLRQEFLSQEIVEPILREMKRKASEMEQLLNETLKI